MESMLMNWPRGIPIYRSRVGSDERERDPTGGDGKVKCTKRERSKVRRRGRGSERERRMRLSKMTIGDPEI